MSRQCISSNHRSFGVAAIGNIKPLIKTLPKIFGHSDKTVRAEGTALVLALYAYLGPAVQASLGDLKPVQLAELQKSFDSLDADGKGAGTGKPSRFTRKAQREQEASGGADTPDEVEAPAPMDPKDLLEAVDVSKLFPADLDERLSSSKWKDRLEALEEVNKVLSAPANVKIAESNMDAYGSLAQTLGAKCKSDANVNVVIEAAKVVEGLAMGLGKPFGRYRNAVMPGMLERLKERKATVVEALGKALDAVFTTVSSALMYLTPGSTVRYHRRRARFCKVEKSPSQRRHSTFPLPFIMHHDRCSKQGPNQTHGRGSRRVAGRLD